MLSAQASAFVASAPHAEASMREQLLHVVSACNVRHAHMAAITPIAFATGLALDFTKLREAGRELERRLEVAREITAESAAGTRLTMKTSTSRRWLGRFGSVRPGETVVLPAGSIVTCPDTISGTFVANASVGEFFGAREGLLAEPVTFELVDGRVMNVVAKGAPHLVRDIENLLHVAPNSDRVGLVVFGVNTGIGEATGDVTVDQHRPGLHLVFGDPMGKVTGATWSARTSFAACQIGGAVRVDGTLVADEGKLLPG
jgi:leucyl aminopeptidase (aminopeptidase T)